MLFIFFRVSIRLGEHDLRRNPDCSGTDGCSFVDDYKIEKIVNHPGYRETTKLHDISLIRVDRDINFTREKIIIIYATILLILYIYLRYEYMQTNAALFNLHIAPCPLFPQVSYNQYAYRSSMSTKLVNSHI